MCISERGKEEGGEKGKGEMGEGYLDRRKIGGKSFSSLFGCRFDQIYSMLVLSYKYVN